ncbi:type 4a pilus biogenesis protein PilO [Thermosulfurimonas dismutans]|uniref:type 4a pilus biogenesis protein PilO n=1 Tax=Thermosulfurimonas dismutans TaxID=999894 RepID=UPI000B0AAD84|nr:type 4a pilus biogenesis protein PilO [Thermosulfurimonas dismutans]
MLKEKVLVLKMWFGKQLESLSFQQKCLLAILSLLLPSFLYGYWYFVPKYKNIKGLRREIIQLKEEISKYKKLALQKTLLEKKLQRRKIFLKKIIVTLPSEKEIPELLSNVSEQAKRSGLEVISFTPRREIPQDYYNIIPFDIEVKGDFQQLVLFLDKVERLLRIITLNNIYVNIGEVKNNINLYSKCTFYTYRYTGKVVTSSSGRKKK